ncbi:MAG TPA: LytTR family DNA-binding domain-containing protein [Puia sp.]|nr:LytTR family DNA-binding domain-containing protein [Puia sp.]
MGFQYKYIIVDDDELSRISVEAEASKFSFLSKTGSCSNAIEAMELVSRCNPDIIFADVEMPEISGIDFIKAVSGKKIVPVFITSHPEFALEGYELEAFDYLLKPLSEQRFERCALRLRDFFELKQNAYAFTKELESNRIVIKQGYDKYKIDLSEVLYLEAMKDYTKIVTVKKNYLVLETITGMQNKLPKEKFLRIHRSYVVNQDKIEAVKTGIIIIGMYELPIGKMYKDILQKHFINR